MTKLYGLEWQRICTLSDDELLAEFFEGMTDEEIAAYCKGEVL